MRRALVDNSVWRHAVEADNEFARLLENEEDELELQLNEEQEEPTRGERRRRPRAWQ